MYLTPTWNTFDQSLALPPNPRLEAVSWRLSIALTSTIVQRGLTKIPGFHFRCLHPIRSGSLVAWYGVRMRVHGDLLREIVASRYSTATWPKWDLRNAKAAVLSRLRHNSLRPPRCPTFHTTSCYHSSDSYNSRMQAWLLSQAKGNDSMGLNFRLS